ncbi:MAG TPA: DUF1360 domain-containing protein [Acidimicrobiales bacterium]|nr:DUF1360 domain-containing protein [Acidimicrobiales bacterium]
MTMPIDWLEFVVLALAAYRITRFLLFDSLLGMGLVGKEFASPLAAKVDRFGYDEEGNDRSWIRGKLSDLLTCPWCLGFWISAAAYFSWLGATEGWDFIVDTPLPVHGLVVFAIAAVQGYLNSRPGA